MEAVSNGCRSLAYSGVFNRAGNEPPQSLKFHNHIEGMKDPIRVKLGCQRKDHKQR